MKSLSIPAFASIVALTPIIVLFSGMAMVPVLIVLAIVMAASLPRKTLWHPQLLLPNYRTLLIAIGIILAVPLLTSPWSLTPGKSFDTAARVLVLCIIGVGALICATAMKRPSMNSITAYAISMVAVSVLIFQETFLDGGVIEWMYHLREMDYERFIDKNINRGLCALTILIWPLVFALYLHKKHHIAWYFLALLALPIMLMHSLSAKLGLCASILAFVALHFYPVTASRLIAVLLSGFLLSFPFLFTQLDATVFADPLVRNHLPESALHRISIWHVLLEQSAQKPWLGWGMDTTRAMPLSAEQFTAIHLQTPPLHPHNPSIQLLVEGGLLGFLATVAGFIFLLRAWIRMPIDNSYYRTMVGTVMVAYFFTGLSSFGMWQYWWIATLWVAGILVQWIKLDGDASAPR
jgi:O-antigen ligase